VEKLFNYQQSLQIKQKIISDIKCWHVTKLLGNNCYFLSHTSIPIKIVILRCICQGFATTAWINRINHFNNISKISLSTFYLTYSSSVVWYTVLQRQKCTRNIYNSILHYLGKHNKYILFFHIEMCGQKYT
jgi:hypothetical protein